jgi:hypothetical protein
MIDVIAAATAMTKAYTGVRAFIEAGKSIEDTFQVVARWQGHASDVLYASQRQQKRANPFKKLVFAESVEAEGTKMFAARKKATQQRAELITMITYAYGNEGIAMWRECIKEVQQQRQREVYAQQDARDTMIKSFWIVVLVLIGAGLIGLIIDAVITKGA